MKTFVISDTHFNHNNIIRYCNRPFLFVDEMDETLIRNWNSVVSENDLVYHLGDIGFYKSDFLFDVTLSRLNGRKKLILGNHDNAKSDVILNHFETIDVSVKLKKHNIIMTHYPIYLSEFDAKYNIHGHIHDKIIKDKKYINVSVEHINYTPILLDDIIKKLK